MLKHVSHWVYVGVVLSASTAWAAKNWNYHPRHDGDLTVYATINCVRIGDPLFTGHVDECESYSGRVPWWANDYEIVFVADPPGCENRNEQYKVAVRWWNVDKWELRPLEQWLDDNLDGGSVVLPAIADMRDAGVQTIYSVVDLDVWLAAPGPLQDTYDITDGTCPDLPGFLIGTTPITFDPNVGSGENPFQTTPLTGPVNWVGDVGFGPVVPAVSEWGMVVLVLFLLTGITIAFRRQRRLARAA